MRINALWGGPILGLAILPMSSRGGEELGDLLKRAPGSANAVSVIRVGELFRSPLSRNEGWSSRQQLFDVVPMPRTVELVMTASQWDPSSANRSWIIGQARMRQPVSMPQLATREQSVVETISGFQVVLTRRNSFFIGLGPTTLGAVYPPNRGELTRWLRFVRASDRSGLAQYLIDAANSDSSAHLISAIDMQHLIDPRWLKSWLTGNQALKDKRANVEALTRLIAGLKGARLTVRLEDKAIPAQVRLDFSEPIGGHEAVLKPLFLAALEDLGAHLDDFGESKVEVEGATATLRCNLSRQGVARILMLILAPASDLPPEDAKIAGDPALLHREASLRYWQTVSKLLDDLQRKDQRARNYNQTAVWHDTSAQQIEQLPAAHVDQELLEFGARVAARLRGLAGSLRGVPVQVELLQAQKQFRFQVQPGGWGGWGWGFQPAQLHWEDNFKEVQAKQADVIVKDQESREKLWGKIMEDRSDTRLKMQQKFKTGFDASQ